MSYEIPKNLKYQEKILFNLSLPQAGWLGLFGVITIAVFIKTPLSLETKAATGIILTLIGIGFAFFNLKTHSQTAINFFTKPQQLGYLDKRMAEFIEVKKIENNTIQLKNGSTKAILQVQPINFHILSKKQQQATVQAYKDFLNSLDHPIQIAMRTVNLNLDDYLQQLEQKVKAQKKEQLLTQFNEFQEFIRNYIEKNTVKNRLFYIIIPSEKNKPEQLDILLSSYFEGFIEAENEYQNTLTTLEEAK